LQREFSGLGAERIIANSGLNLCGGNGLALIVTEGDLNSMTMADDSGDLTFVNLRKMDSGVRLEKREI
jgi:hypothetical protein